MKPANRSAAEAPPRAARVAAFSASYRAAAQQAGEMNAALDRRMASAWLARVTLIMVAQEKSTQLSPDELRAEFHRFVVPAFLPPARAGSHRTVLA